MVHDDNAVTALAEAVARVGRHRFPVVVTADRAGVPRARSPTRSASSSTRTTRRPPIAKLGPIANIIGATIRNTANPTRLAAGYKDNVIPGRATRHHRLPHPARPVGAVPRAAARGDRPGHRASSTSSASRRWRPPSTAPWSRRWPRRCAPRTRAPAPVPYMLSGGTDAKAFAQLGIRCFGFAPLRLPADLNFAALFHGIDERVPVDGLQFGVRVLDRFLRSC